jgi:hypothetical protein
VPLGGEQQPRFEEPRSPGNDCSVVLLPAENVPDPDKLEEDVSPFLHAMTVKRGYHDHRQDACGRAEGQEE